MEHLVNYEVINWEVFKEYKYSASSPKGLNNFDFLLRYLELFHKVSSVKDYFDILQNDELASMMLKKRSIESVEDLQMYLIEINSEDIFGKKDL